MLCVVWHTSVLRSKRLLFTEVMPLKAMTYIYTSILNYMHSLFSSKALAFNYIIRFSYKEHRRHANVAFFLYTYIGTDSAVVVVVNIYNIYTMGSLAVANSLFYSPAASSFFYRLKYYRGNHVVNI